MISLCSATASKVFGPLKQASSKATNHHITGPARLAKPTRFCNPAAACTRTFSNWQDDHTGRRCPRIPLLRELSWSVLLGSAAESLPCVRIRFIADRFSLGSRKQGLASYLFPERVTRRTRVLEQLRDTRRPVSSKPCTRVLCIAGWRAFGCQFQAPGPVPL